MASDKQKLPRWVVRRMLARNLSKVVLGCSKPWIKNGKVKYCSTSFIEHIPAWASVDGAMSYTKAGNRLITIGESDAFRYRVKTSKICTWSLISIEEAKEKGLRVDKSLFGTVIRNNWILGYDIIGCKKCDGYGWYHDHVYNEEKGDYTLEQVTCDHGGHDYMTLVMPSKKGITPVYPK